MIKIGILGAAKIAPKALISPASLRDDCEITCVASRNEQKAKNFAREHNIPNVETSYEALVERDDIDLVYNALPPNRHCDLSVVALRAGKAVLCEKPFAMNAQEAQQMVDASIKYDRPLIEGFHYRYHPAFVRYLEIIRSGTIGNVKSIDAAFDVAIPYREGELRHVPELGGGALMDLGCYPVHWVRTIMGAEPVSVTASCETERPGIDISTSADVTFANGVLTKIGTSMADGMPFRAEITVIGSAGTAHMENLDHQLDHVMAVLSGDTLPITAGEDAVANMKLIDAIYRSAGLR